MLVSMSNWFVKKEMGKLFDFIATYKNISSITQMSYRDIARRLKCRHKKRNVTKIYEIY